MTTLHVLAHPAAIADCRRALAPADRIILVADGVFVATQGKALAEAARVGALAADAEQRGVPLGEIEPLSYADFVAWAVACERSVTWR